MKNLIKRARKLAKPFRVTDDSFRLKDVDPSDTLDLTSQDKPRAKDTLDMGVDLLAEMQDMLYAQAAIAARTRRAIIATRGSLPGAHLSPKTIF
jgi:hypothetical protein